MDKSGIQNRSSNKLIQITYYHWRNSDFIQDLFLFYTTQYTTNPLHPHGGECQRLLFWVTATSVVTKLI